MQTSQHSQQCYQGNNYDFIIYTDGSGYLDHIGAHAGIVVSTKFPKLAYVPSFGCGTHMETGRAELIAVIGALHSIFDTNPEWNKQSHLDILKKTKPTILVVSDRDSVVGVINGVYKPSSNRDMWAAFNWFAEHFYIRAVHVGRKTNPTQDICDIHASQLRIVLNDYIYTQKEVEHY